MSVKQFTLAIVGTFLVLGFGYVATGDLVKRKDAIKFQQIQLKSESTKLKELDVKYDNLNKDLEKASTEKQQDAEELKKLEQQKQQLELEKQKLEAELQARAEQKSKLAQASNNLVNTVTMTGTASAQSGSIQDIIVAAANKHGLSASYMLQVAKCESTFNPNAVNTGYYAGGGHPTGLYQFLPETWNRISSRSPYGTQPWSQVTNGYINAHVTAWAFANGYSGEWECA